MQMQRHACSKKSLTSYHSASHAALAFFFSCPASPMILGPSNATPRRRIFIFFFPHKQNPMFLASLLTHTPDMARIKVKGKKKKPKRKQDTGVVIEEGGLWLLEAA